jgi:uncharacterized protein involved in type VI secretion and phage assembly
MQANAIRIGQVTQIGADPTGAFPVQVTIPAVNEGAPIWARMIRSCAASPDGAASLFEIGDEVVIASIDDDPLNPVILSGLFSMGPTGL